MKTVSTDFLAAQRAVVTKEVREIYYKRRFWDAGEGRFVWESTWRNVEKRGTTSEEAESTSALFELRNESEYSLADPSIPLNFNIGDEFGFNGRISGQPYPGIRPGSPGASPLYTVQVSSNLINATYNLVFYDDQVSFESSSAWDDFLIDTTEYHEYRFVIKNDLSLDMYVDGVLDHNFTSPSPNFAGFDSVVFGAIDAEAIFALLWYKRFLAHNEDAQVVTPETRAISKIKEASPVTEQLDSEQLTEFKVSNVSITLENFDNEWDPDNPEGHFGPSEAVPAGYEPYWTKFQIRTGLILEDGTKEFVKVFTGMAVEFRRNGNDRNVQIDLQGQEAYMLNESAEDIATHIVDEDAGVGNGVQTEFDTINVGVGGVSEVKVAGIVQVEGDKYQVSQLNEFGVPAKITFTDAPDLAEQVLISYFFWPPEEEFNDLVELLIDGWLNSDPGNSIDVQPFVVSNAVINAEEFTNEADWESGTLNGLNSNLFSGSLVVDWENSGFREYKPWLETIEGWAVDGFTGVLSNPGSDRIRFERGSGAAVDIFFERTHHGLSGSWEFKARIFNPETSVSILEVKLFNEAGLAGFNADFQIGSIGWPSQFFGETFDNPDDQEHTYTVTRTATGVIRLYIDGVLTVTSTYNGPSNRIGFRARLKAVVNPAKIEIRDLYVPTSTAVAVWESPIIDWTTIPFAWAPFQRSLDLDRNGEEGGASIQIETDTSADNFLTSTGYEVMAPTDERPNSPVLRYAKVKITLTVDQSTSAEPAVNSFKIQANSFSIPVLLPELSGLNKYESLQKLAAFANYEMGITSEQQFFFRPKATVGEPVMDLSESDFIHEVTDFQNGYDRVYSKVEITYGDYVKRVEAPEDSAASPATRFLKRTFELSADGNIKIAPSADIATAMARDYFDRLSVLRPRFKIRTTFLPQLDLSDLIRCTYAFDKTGSTRKLLDRVPAKIIGARHDSERGYSEFDLEAVPS